MSAEQPPQQQAYKGLANIGATCYMNSLLQTLFMTRQFRNVIYRWRYDEKRDGKKEDSILYQLQRLFARLETKHPLDVDTRDLVKSFQWGGEQILEQQDIQEFNRVLFDALQQSFRLKPTGKNDVLAELYEGVMLNYTRCRVCSNQPARQETFQDVLIAVKNKYTRLYNDSVELGLQRYLKPERLDGSNLYFCEVCQCKVEADRFVKFLKLPKLLGLMLQRFTFDYVTESRQKLNDEVRFPWVLNMNDFMDGYEGIPNKLSEDKPCSEFEEPPPAPAAKPLVIKRSTFLKRGKDTKLPNNIKNKPTPATRGFLSEMRKKTGKNNEPTIEMLTKEKYAPLTEEQLTQQAIEESLKDMRELDSSSTKETTGASTGTSVSDDNLTQRTEQSQPEKIQEKPLNSLPALPLVPPPIPELPPATTTDLSPPPPILEELDRKAKLEQEEQTRKKKLEDERQLQQFLASMKQQVEKYLQQGPMVYQLYSILIHSGGPHHGHYYAYIRSLDDGKWYCFNDYKVTELNVQEMLSTVFGGKGGTNAYGLYYRQIDKEVREHEPIPEEIAKELAEELAKERQVKEEKLQNEDKYIKLKLAYQLYVKTIEVMNTMTLGELLQRAKLTFGADHFKDVKPHNIRLRLFNPVNEMKLDTFTGREDRTLEQLRIGSHKCLLLETKRDGDVFEEYVAGKQSLRLAVWSREVCSLEESTLNTVKYIIE